jgi:hypothetical protein
MQGGNRGGKGFARETTQNYPDSPTSISGITKGSPVPYKEVTASHVDPGRGTSPVSGTSIRGREAANQQVMSPKEATMSQTDEIHELRAQMENLQDQYTSLTNAMNSLSIRSGVQDMQFSSLNDTVPRSKEADKITLPKLGEREQYDAWRTTVMMYLPAACAQPQDCEEYLARLEDPDDDLSSIPNNLILFDRKMRAALLIAFDRASEQGRRLILHVRTKRDVTGLQLFRYLDQDFHYKHGLTQADYILQTLESLCPSEDQFSEFITSWRANIATLDGTEDELSERMKSTLLCKKVEHLDFAKAAIQQWKSTKFRKYDGLVEALYELDIEKRHELLSKKTTSSKRGSARASKPQSQTFSPSRNQIGKSSGSYQTSKKGLHCTFCSEYRKGNNGLHSSEMCWFNPNNKSFAPTKRIVKDFMDKNKHLFSHVKEQNRRSYSQASSNQTDEQKDDDKSLSSAYALVEKKRALAAQLLSDKDVLDYMLERSQDSKPNKSA